MRGDWPTHRSVCLGIKRAQEYDQYRQELAKREAPDDVSEEGDSEEEADDSGGYDSDSSSPDPMSAPTGRHPPPLPFLETVLHVCSRCCN